MRQINLFNPALLPARQQFSTRMMLQTAALLALVVMLLLGWQVWREQELLQRQAAAAKQLKGLQERLTALQAAAPPPELSQQLQTRVQGMEQRLQGLQQMQNWLSNGQRGNTEGYSRYLQAFARQHLEGLWLTGFLIDSQSCCLELYGRALQPELVAQWLGKLNAEPVLRGKSLQTVHLERPMLSAQLQEEAPVAPAAAPAAPSSPAAQDLLPGGALNAQQLLGRLNSALNQSAAPAAPPAPAPAPVRAKVEKTPAPRPAPWVEFSLKGGAV
ncbi:hypothetical protein V8J88_06795 [Massilia sp. W12]|uniref:hypothetical protein n=1 Tax=Massilia sp. W12 TaxID=3126507 RepID=UPI0030D52732